MTIFLFDKYLIIICWYQARNTKIRIC